MLNGILVEDILLQVQVPGLTRLKTVLLSGTFVGRNLQSRFRIDSNNLFGVHAPLVFSLKRNKSRLEKNLRDFSRAFDEDDAAEESNVSAELTAQRKRLVDEWNAWRNLRRKEVGEDRMPSSGKEEAKEEIELWIDEVIEQIEEEIVEES